MSPVLSMPLGALGPLALCARVVLVARQGGYRRAHDHPADYEGLVGPPTPYSCRRPLAVRQPPGGQVDGDRRIDLGDRDPVAQPQPHAEVRATLAQLRKQHSAWEAAIRHECPAYAGREGLLQLLEEGQGGGPEAPLRPWIRDDRPADGERAPSDDDACQPDFPGPEPGRVQGHDGLARRHERERQGDQPGTDHGLIKPRPRPPPAHPPEARPPRAGLRGWQGPSQRGCGDALGNQETQHRPGDGGYNRGVRRTQNGLDPLINGGISYLCGRHDCSLLHAGGSVTGTVYENRIPTSS